LQGRPNPVRADAVKVNDRLLLHPFSDRNNSMTDSIRVIRIEKVVRQGVYAPFTASGTIVVQAAGIVASTYVSLQDTAAEFVTLQNGFELRFLSQQGLCHLWMTPYRLFCLFGSRGNSFCEGETYTEEGRSFWVHFGKSFANWGDQQPLLIQWFVLTLVLAFLVFALVLEALLNTALISPSWLASWMALVLLIIASSYSVIRIQRRSLHIYSTITRASRVE
jgi:hypothetical protein